MTISHSETEDRYLTPLRGLNEFVYCPRLFHLMYVQGLFEENLDTLSGTLDHQRRLNKSKAASSPEEGKEKTVPWRSDLVREFSLSSESMGIFGKFDVILSEGEEIVPVEVKRGPAPGGTGQFNIGPHPLPGYAWGNDQVQLAGQMALLREAGYSCSRGRIYYRQTETLVEIPWSESLADILKWVSLETSKLISASMPDPLQDSKKCIRCSLNHVCLPDETLYLKEAIREPRQLYPGRDDCGVLHLTTPGTRLSQSGEVIDISVPGEKEVHVPMKDISHVCLWGGVQITTQALLKLADRGVGLTWLTGGGWLRAVTNVPLAKNVELRRGQYRLCDSPVDALQVARWIVTSKIENQRVLIRRNKKGATLNKTLETLKACRENSVRAKNLETLRGIEGFAAKTYWEAFPSILKGKNSEGFLMDGRNRRPPRDPVNALLSFGYAMLLRDFMTALHGVGFDPLYGFYHSLVPGRPALALDMMEAFRPLVVDSAVARAINEGVLSEKDFIQTKGFCAMKPNAKKNWIKAYERRVDELVTHPVFGYRLSYRRIFTLECRLFGRYLSEEFQEYHPMTTR